MHELTPLGILGFWAQADAVGKSAALLLLAMSVATWYLIVTKTLQLWRIKRHAQQGMDAFWGAPELAGGVERMAEVAPRSPFHEVAAEGAAVRMHDDRASLAASLESPSS